MTESMPGLVWHRKEPHGATAIVFVHGFGGDAIATWGRFPELLMEADALREWDVASLGYRTSLTPGLFEGLWTGSPSLRTLGGLLGEIAKSGGLRGYRALALVAHSMGGLVVQRALLDSPELEQRTSHVFMFGTPSDGLAKASWFQRLKRQVRDMAREGDFITTLREDWSRRYAKPAFTLRACAGDEDQFVPPRSALAPFSEEQTGVVVGNHLTMVKPDHRDALAVQVVVTGIQGVAAPRGPWSSARLALEMRDFQAVVDHLLPKSHGLDDQRLVTLALALDGLGRGAEAIEVLERAGRVGTDAQGVRAGRLKRRWLQDGQATDGDGALSLYSDAYARAVGSGDWSQAFYHGINVAFMTACFIDDLEAARAVASDVLDYCQSAPTDHWSRATEGEACFYLARWRPGFRAYERALELCPSPREIQSMHEQAAVVIERCSARADFEERIVWLNATFGRSE